MHRRQETERHEDRGGQPESEGSRRAGPIDGEEDRKLAEEGQPVADVTEGDRPDDRAGIRHELAARKELLDEPPGVPGADRDDREDAALVLPEVAEIRLRSARGDEGEPQDDDRGRPDGRRPRRSPPAVTSQEPRSERDEEGKGLRLRHDRDGERDGSEQGVPAHREDEGNRPEEHVDRLVLAPPRADVDDRGVVEDREAAEDRPARRRPEVPRDEPSEEEVEDARRELHDGSHDGVGRCGHRLEVGELGGQPAPDVDHHRREGDVHVVGMAERLRREAVDPEHELVEIAGEPRLV